MGLRRWRLSDDQESSPPPLNLTILFGFAEMRKPERKITPILPLSFDTIAKQGVIPEILTFRCSASGNFPKKLGTLVREKSEVWPRLGNQHVRYVTILSDFGPGWILP